MPDNGFVFEITGFEVSRILIMKFMLKVPCIPTERAASKKRCAALVEAQVMTGRDMESCKKTTVS